MQGQAAIAVGEDKLRPAIPPTVPRDLAGLAEACFEAEPDGRPSFGMIVSLLCHIIPEVVAAQQRQVRMPL